MSDVHALTGAYAVDALDRQEREQFEAHLAQCDDCRLEVDGLREAGALLALTADAAPPASLRARVLADVATVRPLPPTAVQDRTSDHPAPAPAAEQAAEQSAEQADDGRVVSLGQHAARRRRRAPLLVAAAAVLVAGLGAGAVVWQPWDQGGAPTATDPAQTTDPSPSPSLSALDRIVDAPDAQTQARVLDSGGSVTVVRSRELGEAAVIPQGISSLPSDEVYELWLRLDGEFVSAGLMSARDDAVVLRGDATDAEAVGITVESSGGSPTGKPTTQPIAYFPLATA